MLNLPDASGTRLAPVRPARPGELRVWVAGPAAPRPCLVADLVFRVAGRHHLRASVSQPAQANWDTLNIYPAQVCAAPPQPLDVVVASPGPQGHPMPPAAHLLPPGQVRPGLPGTDGLDPLALRLALLRHPYRADVVVTRDDLAAAAQALLGWRAQVAHWAQSPSKPMSARYVGGVLGWLDDDLDTPAALRTLSALAADPAVPDGAKFESFAHLDRFFGLDLAREVGR